MLTVPECRKILDGLNLSDQEIEKLRDSLYALIGELIDEIINENTNEK